MRVVLAPDGFKECMSAAEVCEAMALGVARGCASAEVLRVPLADGGEGTVEALVTATGGRRVVSQVRGPLGKPVEALYGILGDEVTAVIEMAAASGLHLVAVGERNPKVTSTYGTGELMREAIEVDGVKRIVLGLGGSATNDAGAGMAQALGYRLLDEQGAELAPGGAALARLARIDSTGRLVELDEVEIDIACDVSNPLCGQNGASRVYGPQKGASVEDVAELDAALGRFAEVVRDCLGRDVAETPGAGAAGGLGAGLLAFTQGRMRRGFDVVADACGLRKALQGADLVLTGEGRLDEQTLSGKVVMGVLEHVGGRYPVVAIAGSLGKGYEGLYAHGLTAAFSVVDGPMTLAEALEDAPRLVTQVCEHVVRLSSGNPFGERSSPHTPS